MSKNRQAFGVRENFEVPPPVLELRYGDGFEGAQHSLLGLASLLSELESQGVALEGVLGQSGLAAEALSDPHTRMTHEQKLQLFRNVLNETRDPAIGLRAGLRQRLSDFGLFGYALSSSATFGDAIAFGMRHVRLVGPVLEKRFRQEGGHAIFEGRHVANLGELLPLISEFWFSSINTLIGRIMERPVKGVRLLLPYPPPAYAGLYKDIFQCDVEFESGLMEWHFDVSLLDEPCPNANPITADMCAAFCAHMLESLTPVEPELIRLIRSGCLNEVGGGASLEEIAEQQHVSLRTLQRRLADAGYRYQDILDDVRRRLAVEFLSDTAVSIEEIAEHVGFSDASNFRKAFKKWTGLTPADYRARMARTSGKEQLAMERWPRTVGQKFGFLK